jgi:hypothetical protein
MDKEAAAKEEKKPPHRHEQSIRMTPREVKPKSSQLAAYRKLFQNKKK